MDPVRCLVFDDDDDGSQILEIKFALQEEWSKFRWANGSPLPSLEPTYISNKNELLAIIHRSNLQDQFDFFLCDIYVGVPPAGDVKTHERRPQPDGYGFMKTARQHGVPLCFALTSGNYGTEESYHKAKKNFAGFYDRIYLKSELKGLSPTQSPAQVIAEIAELLRSKGLIRTLESRLQFDTSIQESRTLGIVEEVGEVTLLALAEQVSLPGANAVSVSALAPGLSGAKVLKLTYSGPRENFSTRPILLKVGRDRQSLERELTNFRQHLREPGRRLARSVAQPRSPDSGPWESNGWFAISFECAAPATSLIEWLTTSEQPDNSRVETVLDGLFFGGYVADTYSTTKEASIGALEGILRDLMSHYRTMAVLEAIREFQPLIKKYDRGRLGELDFLRILLSEGRLEGVAAASLSRRLTPVCLVHGDLHGRNILITGDSKRNAAVLIDLASMRRSVWMTDLVRLLCDVFLSGWDRGQASLEWSGLKSWRNQLGQILPGLTSGPAQPTDAANLAVRSAAEWLFLKRFDIAGIAEDAYSRGEFLLGLGVEFARASYRDRDLSAPKRAFALMASEALLREASASFSRPT